MPRQYRSSVMFSPVGFYLHFVFVGTTLCLIGRPDMARRWNSNKAGDVSRSLWLCSEHCLCSQNGSVSCKDISYVPEVPSDTDWLSMDRSYLKVINKSTLANITTLTLKYLGLTRCRVERLSNDSFLFLTFGQNSSIDLSGNRIPAIEIKEVVCNLQATGVTEILLNNMSLTRIPHGFLDCLYDTSVKFLSLEDNWIESFPGYALSTVPNLEILKLDSNKLHQLNVTNLTFLRELSLSRNKFETMPQFTDDEGKRYLCPKLDTLVFEKNKKFSTVACSQFKGLVSLKKISLRSNSIRKLPNNLFAEMPKLTEVNVEGNKLNTIEKNALISKSLEILRLGSLPFPFKKIKKDFDVFKGCPNLRKLFLSNNDLNQISKNQLRQMFAPLQKLNHLDLGNTQLYVIPRTLFGTLPSLDVLDLSANRISKLKSIYFINATQLTAVNLNGNRISVVNETSFPQTLLSRLNKLNLGLNPFSCTCGLTWFRKWINETNIDLGDVDQYVCASPPKWRKIPLMQFNPTDQDCNEEQGNIFIPIGASLSGLVAIDIIAVMIGLKYKNHIRYIYLLCRSRLNQYTELDDVTLYCYDAYVVYSPEDQDWVMDELVPRVEEQEGYKLCLVDRDVIPRGYVVDDLMENLKCSRKIIAILSDNFAKHDWCTWQLTMAQTICLDKRKDILIVVKLEEIRQEHMNNRLMLLMRDKVYIDWSDSSLDRHLFWQKIVTALTRPYVANEP